MAAAPHLFAPDVVASLQAHPAFQEYLRRSTAVWPGEAADDAILIEGLRDARHWMTGNAAIHLVTSPGGLTATRLGALLQRLGLPAARAPATIALMRFLSLLEPTPQAGDSRVRAYQPTPQMAAAYIERIRRELAAAALVDPEAAVMLERFGDPAFALSFVGRAAEIGLAMIGTHRITGDSLNAISMRIAGTMLLGRLIGLADREGGSFPPVGRVSFSVATMAKACGVSRTQIRRILQAGAEAGHFVLHGEGQVELTQRLAEHVALLGVAKLIGFAWASARVLELEAEAGTAALTA